jgi:hypothetical protein
MVNKGKERETTVKPITYARLTIFKMSGLFGMSGMMVQREISNVYATCTHKPDRITANQQWCKVQGLF